MDRHRIADDADVDLARRAGDFIGIDVDARDWDKASDHVPVLATFDL